MRAERLNVNDSEFYVHSETALDEILLAADAISPDILIIDSIQTIYASDISSSPGSVGQVKECTMSLLKLAKSCDVTIFLIGHVNKEGAIAGPKVLEHMVDCVLYFEGERFSNFRILRAAKNRFGSTNEIGVFEMRDRGLFEVENPSELLLTGHPTGTPGNCVTCVIEGTRPLLAEVQALATPKYNNVPQRNSNGVEYNRAMMLLAVLEKCSGLKISGCDAYINVVGGLSLDEPAADLAVILALASSYMDKAINDELVAIGEVGLTGELRPSTQMSLRLSEAHRLGFGFCLIPKVMDRKITVPKGLRLVTAKTILEAIDLAIG
jgi:DNA repair protein RadA/Sms